VTGPNDHGLSPSHRYRAVDASLERLQVDHIDLYQIHAWDPLTPADEWLSTLDDLVRVRRIRYVGVSNLTGGTCNGWLTGKYRRDERPTGSTRLGEDPNRGVEAYDTRNTERTWDILEVVGEVARDHGVTMGQVALAWVTAQPMVDSTILGVRTLEQLQDNLGAVELSLTIDDLRRPDAVSAPPTPAYPCELFGRMVAGRLDLLG